MQSQQARILYKVGLSTRADHIYIAIYGHIWPYILYVKHKSSRDIAAVRDGTGGRPVLLGCIDKPISKSDHICKYSGLLMQPPG